MRSGMFKRSFASRQVIVFVGAVAIAGCAASDRAAGARDTAPNPPPAASARPHQECLHAVRELVAQEIDGGTCESSSAPPPSLPSIDAWGIKGKAGEFWCADDSGQCERGRTRCECALGPSPCHASKEAYCFETTSCTDGRRKYALACYRSSSQCETARPIFGMPGATCHAFVASPPDAKKNAFRDCDPARKNSDGTPKRAPAGPPSHPPETLVLAYDDFGPPAAAWELIGSQWWAWEGGGSWERCDDFDIRVVVFRGVPRKQVEMKFPSAQSKADLVERGLADYRYVEHKKALAYLDHVLAEIAGTPELASMAESLRATRRRIVDALGP
ncbi:Hypothetical protein A7982_08197 [Minicystis rosea]|nr:Hypothetical protein A7982_08197 [Minicystis rosea]